MVEPSSASPTFPVPPARLHTTHDDQVFQSREAFQLPSQIHLHNFSITIRVVKKDRTGQYICTTLSVPSTATGEGFIKHFYSIHRTGTGWYRRRLRALLHMVTMRREAVMIVSFSMIDPESRLSSPPIFINDRTIHSTLTTALHNPSSLHLAHNFASIHLRPYKVLPIPQGSASPYTTPSSMGSDALSLNPSAPQLALMLGHKISKARAFIWFLAAVLISAGAGLVGGVYSNRSEEKGGLGVGLGVGATVFAVLAAAQAALEAVT